MVVLRWEELKRRVLRKKKRGGVPGEKGSRNEGGRGLRMEMKCLKIFLKWKPGRARREISALEG